MHVSDEALLDFLKTAGLIGSRELADLDEARKGNLPLERAIVMRGVLSERDLRRAVAHILGVPFVDLRGQGIDIAVLSHIPEPTSRAASAVAFKKEGSDLSVALLDLGDLSGVKFIEGLHNVRIVPHLTDLESVREALRGYQEALRAEFGDALEREARGIKLGLKAMESLRDDDLAALADDARVSSVVDSLVSHALLSKATNVHIVPGPSDVRVRYRVGGKLQDAAILPKHLADMLSLRAKRLSGLSLRERLPQDGRFKVRTPAGEAALRVSVSPTAHGEKVMMRVLNESQGFTLEHLGLRGETLEAVEAALHKREGLILAAGPKGAGKSTFLYTAIDLIDARHLAVHTVEERVEYPLPRAEQTQVDPRAGLTFARAARAAARSDADVLMLSNIPDAETAGVATAAALSGELVMAGVEAHSAAEAVSEMKRRGADASLLSSSLVLSVGMRVVKRLGRERERYFLNKDELKSLGKLVDIDRLLETLKREGAVEDKAEWKDIPFWRPKKGAWNDESLGMIGLYESLVATPRVRELVLAGAPASALAEEARRQGSLTLLEDGMIKAVQGLTTLEEVLRAA